MTKQQLIEALTIIELSARVAQDAGDEVQMWDALVDIEEDVSKLLTTLEQEESND